VEDHNGGLVDRERIVQYFLDLVRIDSPSFCEHEVARRLERDLAALGLSVTNDHSGPDGTGNLVAVLPGARGRPIALCAHLDTVEPGRGIKPRIVDGVIQSDGTTILGADCKAGVAAIVEAVRAVLERDVPHGHVELLLTYGEERAHVGAKNLDLTHLRAGAVFVIDGVGPPGTIINAAPSYESFRAAFHGRAAHAGLEPENGLSAIAVAAEAIRRMRLGRIDRETTANVGRIWGGSARNAVPDHAALEGEARSHDDAKLVRTVEALRTAMEGAAKDLGASVDLEFVREYSAYRLPPDDANIALAVRAAERLGLTPRVVAMDGGSDASTFAERGMPSVALGFGLRLPHGVEESIAVADLEQTAEYVIGLIREAAG